MNERRKKREAVVAKLSASGICGVCVCVWIWLKIVGIRTVYREKPLYYLWMEEVFPFFSLSLSSGITLIYIHICHLVSEFSLFSRAPRHLVGRQISEHILIGQWWRDGSLSEYHMHKFIRERLSGESNKLISYRECIGHWVNYMPVRIFQLHSAAKRPKRTNNNWKYIMQKKRNKSIDLHQYACKKGRFIINWYWNFSSATKITKTYAFKSSALSVVRIHVGSKSRENRWR